MRINVGLLLLLGLLQAFSMASAQERKPVPAPADPTEDRLMITAGFLSAHPDLRYRLLGLQEIRKNKHEDAFRFFQRAAYYSDKPSQGMVAEMLWNGRGTEKDPALAYAWMDLAAERGYEGFLGLRERYWKSLSEPERQRALAEGQAIYAKYGDAAAQPRLATVLRRERKKITGSRTGFTGNMQIYIPGPGGYESIDATKFFDERYWDPKQYQAWHDSIWMRPRVGRVTVGEIQQAKDESPASRVPNIAPQVDALEPETPERDESELGTKKDG
jgi:uncharacterized protein